jgi:hypothetical protein
MEINFMLAGIIAVVFFVIKFINLRFIKKEDEAIKPIAIDSILVFLSVIIGLLISEQFGMVKNLLGKGLDSGPKAFVANPEF